MNKFFATGKVGVGLAGLMLFLALLFLPHMVVGAAGFSPATGRALHFDDAADAWVSSSGSPVLRKTYAAHHRFVGMAVEHSVNGIVIEGNMQQVFGVDEHGDAIIGWVLLCSTMGAFLPSNEQWLALHASRNKRLRAPEGLVAAVPLFADHNADEQIGVFFSGGWMVRPGSDAPYIWESIR